MPFDAATGRALRRADLNELHVAAAASGEDLRCSISRRLHDCGINPNDVCWIAPAGCGFESQRHSYAPRTPREAIWAIERALCGGRAVVARFPASGAQSAPGGDRYHRQLRRLRALARATQATAVLVRSAD